MHLCILSDVLGDVTDQIFYPAVGSALLQELLLQNLVQQIRLVRVKKSTNTEDSFCAI